MGVIVSTDPERDVATFLAALPEQLTFSPEAPAVVVDRYYTPDFEQFDDGVRLDRDTLVRNVHPARRNVARLRTDVHDVVVSGERFAARYTIHAELRTGAVLVNEVYLLGWLAPDGRIRRIDSTTRVVPATV